MQTLRISYLEFQIHNKEYILTTKLHAFKSLTCRFQSYLFYFVAMHLILQISTSNISNYGPCWKYWPGVMEN